MIQLLPFRCLNLSFFRVFPANKVVNRYWNCLGEVRNRTITFTIGSETLFVKMEEQSKQPVSFAFCKKTEKKIIQSVGKDTDTAKEDDTDFITSLEDSEVKRLVQV